MECQVRPSCRIGMAKSIRSSILFRDMVISSDRPAGDACGRCPSAPATGVFVGRPAWHRHIADTIDIQGIVMRSQLMVAMTIVAATAGGCAECHSPADPSVVQISDVGEFVEEFVFSDGSYDVFLYEGVLVHGDMAEPQFQRALGMVLPELGEDEAVMRIHNYTAWPPSAHRSFTNGEDLVVWSCIVTTAAGCDSGNFWGLSLAGESAIVSRGIWHSD